jgi:hypothetical protein
MAEQQGLSPPGDKKRKAETADHSTSMMTPQRTITTRSQLLQCENALATPPSASTRVGTTPSPKTERQCHATTARKQGAQILEQHVTLHFKGKDFHSVVHVIYGMQFHQMVTKKSLNQFSQVQLPGQSHLLLAPNHTSQRRLLFPAKEDSDSTAY